MNSSTVRAVFCVTIISLFVLTMPVMADQTSISKKKKPTEKSELQQDRLEMETVTVTANKIEEDIQNVPQSIMVIDDEVLKEKGVADIPDVINEIPNMTFRSSLGDSVYFRGLSPSTFTGNNPVVIYIDGIPYSNSYGFNASLANAERIEVLRGPQGTLYGKDAIGAVIKIVTKEPENEWRGNVGAEYGSFNAMQGSFNVSGPLIQDKLYLGVNGRSQQDDGWIKNDYTGDQANQSKIRNLGMFLMYKPTDRFSAKFTLSNDYSKRYGYNGYALPGGAVVSDFDRDDAEHISVDEDTIYENESLAQTLHLKYEFDSITLSSATTHKTHAFDGVWDKDYLVGTSLDGLHNFGNTDSETWTEELRLASNNTEGVRWVVGAYFDTADGETWPTGIQVYRSGIPYEMKWNSETNSKTMALFGQTMIPFGERFELTLGARYQQIDKELDADAYYNQVGVSADPYYSLQADETWTAFLPKAALSYRLNDNWTTYASMAQGYMPGGFTTLARYGTAEDNTFGPQHSTNYEIGVKGKSNRSRLAAAIFYMDIKDTQYSKYVNDTWVTDNAGSSHSLGAELELAHFLTDFIELTAAVGIIDAKYDDYDTGAVVWDGKPLPNTPSHSVRIGAAYFNPNGLYARGDIKSQGEISYYDTVNTEFCEIDSYLTADVKVGYRVEDYDIYAYCNNLNDEEYITAINTGGKTLATYGDPRTFGIGGRYNF